MLSREHPLARAARPAFRYVRGRRDVDCRGFPESARLGQLCPRPSMRTFHVKHCQRRAAGVPGQGFSGQLGYQGCPLRPMPRCTAPTVQSDLARGQSPASSTASRPQCRLGVTMQSWGVVASSEKERGLCPLPSTGVSRETSLSDARPPRRGGKRRSTLLLLDCPPWSGPKFPDSDTQGIGQLRCFEQRSQVVHAE